MRSCDSSSTKRRGDVASNADIDNHRKEACRDGVSQPSYAVLPAEVRQRLVAFIEGGTLELPIMPQVANQVMAMTADPNADLKKLAELISRDPAMAGNVLRICNSPMYMSAMKVVSLQQALSRLGMQLVRQIAIIVSCETRVFRVDGYQSDVHAIFRHSLATALFAQEIARSRRWNVEEGFLCGLLHDVGKPILLQTLVDLHKELKHPIDRTATFGAIDEFHAKVGGYMVDEWKLPARLSEAIVYHHHPTLAPQASQTAMMTNLADDLAHSAVGPRVVEEEFLRKHPMLAPLNLYPDELQKLLDKRNHVVEQVRSLA